MPRPLLLAPLVLLAWALAGSARTQAPAGPSDDPGCLGCHAGLEEMHPWQPLGCTGCHGGDGQATEQQAAHVQPRRGWPQDERVRPLDLEPEYTRFVDPGDLRVAADTCGRCHTALLEKLTRSLHGTTAGHLNDSLYENGVNPTRQAVYGIFGAKDGEVKSEHGLARLKPIASLRPPRGAGPLELATHAADLPAKACMQCHLYSEGVGLPGRLGQDGLYRGQGCSACHVSYAEDGRSRSGDPSIDHFEPGHPLRHEMTATPPTATCVHCHVGDASIGNAFRGLAQLYPNMPAGPDIPGTTDRLSAGQFFLDDPVRLPADLHHDAGMDCIDCHSLDDVMGDGDMYGAMEHAVAIKCTACHGTLEAVTDRRDQRGRLVPNLERKGELFLLRTKRTSKLFRVKQAAQVIDPDHPDYSPDAAAAMTPEHARLECHACHSGWNTNFFGFHFDRNEAFSQLDLIKGRRTPGAVRTQERLFASVRQFVLGFDPDGLIAPYMVGFSSMGSVHAADGSLLIDQGLPETAAGLSGLSLIHHQTHTTQRAARSCVECHRSPASLGLGTGGDTGGSFALARGLMVAVGERGLETLLLDRENPSRSIYLARLPLGGARRVVLDSDPVSGHAKTAFVALESSGVMLVDVSNPAFPTPIAFVAAGDVRDLILAGDLLLIANGGHGLRLVDVADRRQPVLLSDLETVEARGLSLQWPRLFVADGPGGLLAVDVASPDQPVVVGHTALAEPGSDEADEASSVATLFQYGHPEGHDARSGARLLAAVANGRHGLVLLDLTQVESMHRLNTPAGGSRGKFRPRSVLLYGRYELGDTTGTVPTRERDLLAVVGDSDAGSLMLLVDVTDPARPERADQRARGLPPSGPPVLARSFNPPVLVTRLMIPTEGGLYAFDATDSSQPQAVGRLTALGPVSHVAVEAFATDRLLDETGTWRKDISHAGARFFSRDEMLAVLGVPDDALGLLDDLPGGKQAASLRRAQLAARYRSAAVPGGDPARGMPVASIRPADGGEAARRRAAGFVLDADQTLPRLLRASHPLAFDANHDRALSRGELERLVFDLLDVNRDGRLGPLEWPRHPDADPGALDHNHDGTLSRSEMDLSKEVLGLLDLDGDGLVTETEWPFDFVEDVLPTLMYCTSAELRSIVSALGFSARHLRLYQRVAGGPLVSPHDIPDERLEQFVDRARANALQDLDGQPAVGDFLLRFDVDRDGVVEPREFTPFAAVAARCDTNGDGRIDQRDRPDTKRR